MRGYLVSLLLLIAILLGYSVLVINNYIPHDNQKSATVEKPPHEASLNQNLDN